MNNQLIITLLLVSSLIACKKTIDNKPQKVRAYVIELQFELTEDIISGDAIKISTKDIAGEYTIYYDLVKGVNKVTYTVTEKTGFLSLDYVNKDGKFGHLDDIYLRLGLDYNK